MAANQRTMVRNHILHSQQFALGVEAGLFVEEGGVGGEVWGAGGGVGEGVAAFVFGVAGVAFDPAPGDVVGGGGGVEALPEVGVLEGQVVGAGPAAGLPSAEPAFGHGIDEVAGVGVEGDLAGGGEGLEAGDGGEEFHAVVGGAGEAAGERAGLAVVDEEGAVAAGAGVSLGGAVGVDGDVFQNGRKKERKRE